MTLNYMPYVVIGGVLLVSVLAGFAIGWDDAWFVPLAVIPFGLLYLAWDRKKARQQDSGGSGNQGI
jgi:hypothetical protein